MMARIRLDSAVSEEIDRDRGRFAETRPDLSWSDPDLVSHSRCSTSSSCSPRIHFTFRALHRSQVKRGRPLLLALTARQFVPAFAHRSQGFRSLYCSSFTRNSLVVEALWVFSRDLGPGLADPDLMSLPADDFEIWRSCRPGRTTRASCRPRDLWAIWVRASSFRLSE